ncbi:antifungal protein ginkbilobin-like protein [Aristolochia californica]|uniref:antifungal protein ginkbilobin-like protein n=1 Tax=Aristolochia californica TaxID=171875 RepID=UPI0035DDB860
MVSLARLMALIGLWALLCNVVNGVPNTNLTQVLCNGDMFTGGDPFAGNLVYVLDDLEAFAPPAEDRDYYNISPFPITFAYGHARCVATLSNSDCKACLKSARETMLATCVSSIGARAVLYDCNIRYEQYPFTD